MGKRFHTFLSHNSADKPAVEELAHRLRDRGLEPWLDVWNLIPGERWQPEIEKALDGCESCCVFVGPSGLGSWQHEEMRVAISRRVKERGFRVIPVLLPGGERGERSGLPLFLVETTWVEFRASLDEPANISRLVNGIRGVEPEVEPGARGVDVECPYQGLEVFDTKHADRFFGREALTQWLVEDLRPKRRRSHQNRFLAIIGASGSGKSSIARAGLIAALKADTIEGSADWPVVVLTPGPQPLESLSITLNRQLDLGSSSDVTSLVRTLGSDSRQLHLSTRYALDAEPPERCVLILVDQFEEIFTECKNDSHRRPFIENLLSAASEAQGRTVVVLTMRADFYGKCAIYPDLAAAVSTHGFLLGPMNDKELKRAIEHPAQMVGYELEPGLVEILLKDAQGEAGSLPLLQHALKQLWEKASGRRLDIETYRAMGGLEGALNNYANTLLNDFDQEGLEVCKCIFLRLINPGEGTEDTKRRADISEFTESGTNKRVDEVINKLANARLVTTAGDESASYVNIAHEALIRAWSTLREWVEENREFVKIRNRMAQAVQEWDGQGRDKPDEFVYRGVRLAEAEQLLTTTDIKLNEREREFIQASVDFRDHARREEEARQRKEVENARKLVAEQSKAAKIAKELAEEQSKAAEAAKALAKEKKSTVKRQWRYLIGLGVLFLAALGAAIFAVYLKDEANALAVEAVVAEQNAVSAKRAAEDTLARFIANVAVSDTLQSKPSVALLLAVEAASIDYTAITDTALRTVLSKIRGVPLRGHDGPIGALAFSGDGKLLIATSQNGGVRLWRPENPDEPVAADEEAPAQAWALSENRRMAAAVESDKMVRIWDLGTHPLQSWELQVNWETTCRQWHRCAEVKSTFDLALSPNGQFLAISKIGLNEYGQEINPGLQLWDLRNRESPETLLRKDECCVKALAFSPAGGKLATLHGSKSAQLWDARLWDLAAPDTDPVDLETSKIDSGGPPIVELLTFSPAGDLLAAGIGARHVFVWFLDRLESTQKKKHAKYRHLDEVTALVFDPQRKRFASGSADGGIRLWSPRTSTPDSNESEYLKLSWPGRSATPEDENGVEARSVAPC